MSGEVGASAEFKAWLNDPRRLAPNTPGAVDDVTGRVCVRVADYAASELNGDAPAYWLITDAMGMDPWRLVEGVDPHTNGRGFDVWFASGSCKTVGLDGVLYVSAEHAARIAQEVSHG